MPTAEIYLLYLVLGAVAGLASGLFGLGGGVIVVPILIVSFGALNFPAESLTQLAIGTSLATIVLTSINSILTHHKLGSVLWRTALWLTPGMCGGAILGGLFAVSISGMALQSIFGTFLILIGAQMAFSLAPTGSGTMPGTAGKISVSMIIGFISSMIGIGGGLLVVPFLSWAKTSMKNAAGTAAACSLPIAICGAATYIYKGLGNASLPEGSLGYIYLPAFFSIILSSFFFSRIGSKLTHYLPDTLLKKSFCLLLFLTGSWFVAQHIIQAANHH